MLRDAFVDAFIAAADQDDSPQLRESPAGGLIEIFSGRGKQDDGGAIRALRIVAKQRFDRFEQRFGLQNHAFTAAKETVIDGAMAIAREIAQIVNVRFDESRLAGSSHDSEVEWTDEKLREDG